VSARGQAKEGVATLTATALGPHPPPACLPPPLTRKTSGPSHPRIGTPTSADVVVYEEPDEAFYVGIGRDASDKILYIQSGEA
jgi:hypothetical protein